MWCDNKTTTWQDYIDNTLLGSGFVRHAAIFGTDQVKQWACSPNFEVNLDEVKSIMLGFTEPERLLVTGIVLDDMEYTPVKNSGDTILGKRPGGGCILFRCDTLLVIAVYDDNVHASSCHLLMMKLREYLRQKSL